MHEAAGTSLPLVHADATLAVDAERREIAQWSKKAATLFGYSHEEAIGLPLDKLFPEGFFPPEATEAHGVLTGSTKSGRRLRLIASSMRIALHERPAHYIVVMLQKDQDPCRTIERWLKESEERFRAFYENIPMIYLSVGEDRVIRSVNRFGAEYLGYAPSELEGQLVSVLFPWPDNEQAERQLAQAFAQPGDVTRWELRKQTKAGEIIWVREVARAIREPSGEMVVLVVCEDISTLKAMEATLSAQNQRLEHLSSVKDQFVGAVSHELRTPLTSIRGYAEFLEDEVVGTLNAKQQDYVRQIQSNTLRLQRLVDDLLDFSRLEVGEFKLRFERADLSERVREVCAGLLPRVEAAGIKLNVEVPEASVWVRMDAHRIGQVLTNLLDNALKFSPAGGTVGVRLLAEDLQARCVVTDEGPGIAKADQNRIFERFVQLNGGDTRSQGGAGLGLSIARGIVEAHGGRIGVESREGAGSTFYFTLPYKGPAAPEDGAL